MLDKLQKFSLKISDVFKFRKNVELNNIVKDRNTKNRILENARKFNELTADDVMIPRTDIVAVSLDTKVADLEKMFAKTGHTRLPVYKSNMDEIIGFVHIKDCFKKSLNKKSFAIHDILRELILVPKTIQIKDLLARMKSSRLHIAVVLDEYGGTEGLITIEDIIEVIFGDITDEHDKSIANLIKYEGDGALVDGKIEIEDIEEQLNIRLRENEDDDDYDTLAGFMITKLGKIPQEGDEYTHNNMAFKVVESSDRKVSKIKINFNKRKIGKENEKR